MRRPHRALLTVLLSTGTVTLAAPPRPVVAVPEELVVRSAVRITPEAERTLAELAEPRRITLEPGQDRVELARQLCGRLTDTYLGLLAAANAGASPGIAVIPACFAVRTNERLTLLRGESLGSFAKRWIGLAGPKTVDAIRSANGGRRIESLMSTNSEGDSFGMAEAIEEAGDGARDQSATLVVPYRTEPVSYALRAGVGANQAASRLAEALHVAPGFPGAPAAADELELQAGVAPQYRGPALCPVPPPDEAAEWPFPVDALLRVLRRNDELRAQAGLASGQPAAVAVADNGVDGLFSIFPREDLAINRREFAAAQPGDDEDGNGYADDVAGTNIFESRAPGPEEAENREHGTLMAGLVLGGPAFRAAIADAHLSRRVQFRAISLLKRETRATAQGNVITFSLPSEGLSRAVQYARDSELWIVNLSVTGPNRSDPIEGLLLNNPNLLLVVASGNAPLELDLGSPRYPASYSKLENGRRGKVVTVGSHDRRGCFSTFAGRGPQTVDLAAPGENITSIGLGGAAVTSEGTSQATALVSFTAALLRYEGLISASAIKDRLLASVDLQPHLAEFVRSQGALDIVKAVSLNDDVLQLRDDPQKLLFGRLAQPPTLGDLCPALQGAAAARLLKISRRVDGGDASQIRIMFRWRLDPDILQVRYCRPNAATLTLTDTGGTEHRFRLEDVLDLVPAG